MRNDDYDSWICAQMGAREHYAIPRALHAKRRLSLFITDYWAGRISRGLARALSSNLIRASVERHHIELPDDLVHCMNFHGLLWGFQERLHMRRNPEAMFDYYEDVGRRFAIEVREVVRRYVGLSSVTTFFGYNSCSLEVMEFLKQKGVFCILGQIDPSMVEAKIVTEESRRWPYWERVRIEYPEAYYGRVRREWDVADQIVVNSQFSKNALIAQGVDQRKLKIVPLSFEAPSSISPQHVRLFLEAKFSFLNGFSKERPLRVLFLGQVCLRKGIQYLVEASRVLLHRFIEVHVVGGSNLSIDAIGTAPPNVYFHGRTSRGSTLDWYRFADVFVIPTLSDGFAITQLEAMSYGLPVISTQNCGEVVTNNQTGFIISSRNSEELAQMIIKYYESPEIILKHGKAAIERSRLFNINYLGDNLIKTSW